MFDRNTKEAEEYYIEEYKQWQFHKSLNRVGYTGFISFIWVMYKLNRKAKALKLKSEIKTELPIERMF